MTTITISAIFSDLELRFELSLARVVRTNINSRPMMDVLRLMFFGNREASQTLHEKNHLAVHDYNGRRCHTLQKAASRKAPVRLQSGYHSRRLTPRLQSTVFAFFFLIRNTPIGNSTQTAVIEFNRVRDRLMRCMSRELFYVTNLNDYGGRYDFFGA